MAIQSIEAECRVWVKSLSDGGAGPARRCDREHGRFARFLMQVLPEEPFAAITDMLAGIDAQAWKEMQRRIPELEAAGG